MAKKKVAKKKVAKKKVAKKPVKKAPVKPLPCPWCGKAPTVQDSGGSYFHRGPNWEVLCEGRRCPCRPETFDNHKTDVSAVNAWNTRKG